MKRFKKYVSVLLVLALALSMFSACGKEEVAAATEPAPTQIQETAETQAPAESQVPAGFYQVGDKMEDFIVTTYDGKEVSLYKVLEEKDMVLLNLWATWCGPCGSEFPAMQEAYAQYQDKVEIIALSTEVTDTDEVLAEYAQKKGMTFCVARDTIGLGSRIDSNSIPTSIVVDRFGTICLIESGAIPDPAVFANLFELYTAENYTESLFLPSMLAEKPTAQPADPEELNNALNGEGGTLVFTNSSNAYHWPMTVEQKDGRTVVFASNCNSSYSQAVVQTQVDVKAGDVLVLEYKLENDVSYNAMLVAVDDEVVKNITLTKDWVTYAYRFDEGGSHKVSVTYDIVVTDDNYNSNLWIDSIRVVSGEEADKALAANPQYPVAEKTEIQLLNENVQKAYYYPEEDPDTKMVMYFCADPTLKLRVTLDETVDPETAFLEDGDRNRYMLAPYATEDGYVVEVLNNAEWDSSSVVLGCDDEAYADAIEIFFSEEQANAMFELLSAAGYPYKWEYWDESVEIPDASGDVTYTVTYVDQNGDPVPGVMCQVCDESTCQVFTSDANGVCRFTLPAKAYEIHTLMVPAGYEGDTTTITEAPVNGGELTFTLTKK